MGLRKLAAKMVKYNERLEQGKVSKIKPADVEKILQKLEKKCEDLQEEVTRAENPEDQTRLGKKLFVAQEQVKRGKWLLSQIQE